MSTKGGEKRSALAEPSFWERIVDAGRRLLDVEAEDPPRARDVPRHKLPERKDATIARVRQVDATSCGVAVVAMLARQPHATVKAFMFPTPRRHYRTNHKDVWRAMDHFGVRHETKIHRFDSWKTIPADALVTIRWRDLPARDSWHWVLYQRLPGGRFRVIDPGSWGTTLTDIDLGACRGIDYAIVTPRTRSEGPLREPGARSKPQRPPRPEPQQGPESHEWRPARLGALSVSEVRGSDSAVSAIASVTGLKPGAARNRLLKANGRTRVRVVFEDRWPSRLDELGAEPAARLRADESAREELARLLAVGGEGLSQRLRDARGETVREVLAASWPDSARISRERLMAMTVAMVRALPGQQDLALLLGVERKAFTRRLGSAHGATLVGRAFADLVPSGAPISGARSGRNLLLGRFELTGNQWSGGFGDVREAWDHSEAPRRLVVLKWPRGAARAVEVLRKEYARARELRHPGLVGYYDICEDGDGTPVLVIEHGGASLASRLATSTMEVSRALELTRSLADALDYLVEDAQLAHLDVHPGNILVDAAGEPRLTDFGISRHVAGPQGKTQATTMLEGHFPRFAAPEVESGRASRRSDQFSLALVFLSCVSGIDEAVRQLDDDHVPSNLTSTQFDAIRRARSESAARRFESCRAFAAALSTGSS